MKYLTLTFALLLCCAFPVFSQGTITVNINDVLSDCNDPVEILQSTLARKEVGMSINNANNNAIVYAYWVYCQNGQEVAVVEDQQSGFWMGGTTFQYQVSINGGGGDFPAGMATGVYEVKLRLCYWKGVGMTQTINTNVLGESVCSQSISGGSDMVCCDVPMGCIDYTDCPDVSIKVNKFRTGIKATVPAGAIYYHLLVENNFESYLYPYTTSIALRPGCWLYTIGAEYPNGCISVASVYACSYIIHEEPRDREVEMFDGGETETVAWESLLRSNKAKAVQRAELAEPMKLFPVPFSDQLTVYNTETDADLVVSDVSGKMILHESLSQGNTSIDTDAWAPGVYFVRLVNAKGILQQEKIIKQ